MLQSTRENNSHAKFVRYYLVECSAIHRNQITSAHMVKISVGEGYSWQKRNMNKIIAHLIWFFFFIHAWFKMRKRRNKNIILFYISTEKNSGTKKKKKKERVYACDSDNAIFHSYRTLIADTFNLESSPSKYLRPVYLLSVSIN